MSGQGRVQSTDWTVKTVAFWQTFSIVWGENCPRVKVSSKHFVKPLVSFQISEEKVKSAEVKGGEVNIIGNQMSDISSAVTLK